MTNQINRQKVKKVEAKQVKTLINTVYTEHTEEFTFGFLLFACFFLIRQVFLVVT